MTWTLLVIISMYGSGKAITSEQIHFSSEKQCLENAKIIDDKFVKYSNIGSTTFCMRSK